MSRPCGISSGDPRLDLDEASAAACLHALDAFAGFTVPDGSIEVAFVAEDTCRRLHADFFGDPDPTDVMTFPGDPEDGHAGDIAICPAVAARACHEHGLPFAEELTLYLVHAWLHLAGLDDRDAAGRAAMRRGEKRLMGHLRGSGALLRCGWRA